MRILYTILYFISIPFILLRLLIKSYKQPEYRTGWQQRLGLCPINNTPTLWIHTVSMGEAVACTPLIEQLCVRYPNHRILVTTTTPTGKKHIELKFGSKVTHSYTPYDIPFILKHFIHQHHIQACIIMERELWPNIINTCNNLSLPILLINARLSERSTQSYKRLGYFARRMISQIDLIMAQSEDVADRFVRLGYARDHIKITGSIKFDITIDEAITNKALELKAQFHNRPTFIAASTHHKEEQQILEAFALIRQHIPNALLIIAPRHNNRFDDVYTLCQKNASHVARRSQQQPITETTDIYLADTMGELLIMYGAADIAFVGGSFVPVGGHNLIEPAAMNTPVLSGPHLHNFLEIRDLLLAQKALIIAANPEALAKAVTQLLQNTSHYHTMQQGARQVIQHNHGALEETLKLIDKYIIT